MKPIIYFFKLIIILLIILKPVVLMAHSGELPKCLFPSNCQRVEWSFPNLNNAYDQLIEIASSLPRVTVIETEKDYWHGVVRSLVFRFPDDLEILRIPSKKIIQVRSASRIGLSDLGVNQQRIDRLWFELQKSISID